jgi:hypothetical protein
MKLNHCIRINLARDANGHRIPVDERAGTLLDLKAAVAGVNATLDLSDLFFPKVYVDDGLADHRALVEALREYGRQTELRIQA